MFYENDELFSKDITQERMNNDERFSHLTYGFVTMKGQFSHNINHDLMSYSMIMA